MASIPSLRMYQVNAFAKGPFTGNPAAVIVTSSPLADELMQQIATQNNLSETAYCILPQPALGPTDAPIVLRWFTPTQEVDLCGHATLAAAHVLSRHFEQELPLRFETRSGILTAASGTDAQLRIELPARQTHEAPSELWPNVSDALGGRKCEWLGRGHYLLAVLPSAEDVRDCTPDMGKVARLPGPLIISAAGNAGTDFVSRFFVPQAGVPEDPVTGSAHCQLTPYWAERIGRRSLQARQLSPRGGWLHCELVESDTRVRLSGHVIDYCSADIVLPA